MIAEETGATGYEISWHAGHRPTHTFGGRQYTFDEMERLGINAMLGDFNCRHMKYPVVVGVTEPKVGEEELALLEEAEGELHEWQGREYTLYELTQVQRRYERELRKLLREITAAEGLGNAERLSAKVDRLEAKLERSMELVELIVNVTAGEEATTPTRPQRVAAVPGINPFPPGVPRLPPIPSREALENFTSDYLLNIILRGINTNLTFYSLPILGPNSLARILSNRHYENNSQLEFSRHITDQHYGNAALMQMGFVLPGSIKSANGCGWVAPYNAFVELGMDVHPAEIVRYIERNNGLIFDGRFGVNPAIYESLFREHGVEVRTTIGIANNLDSRAQAGQTAILAYFHEDPLRRGAHYITITWNPFRNHYAVWNKNNYQTFTSIDDFLSNGNRTFISLTVVGEREEIKWVNI